MARAQKKSSHVARSALTCSPQRGAYGELCGQGTSAILARLTATLPETYAEFDKKGRGDAVNIDLYGWDADQSVGVVQVRHAFRRYRDGFLNIRKTYVLCGYNENGEPFRHPVGSHAVRAACNREGCTPESVVRASQRWMWGVTDKQFDSARRQGDVLIVPHRGDPTAGEHRPLASTVTIAGTHVVEAEAIVRVRGKPWVFAKRPVLRHLKGQHRDAKAPMSDGQWFTVRAAYEADAWDFSVRLGD